MKFYQFLKTLMSTDRRDILHRIAGKLTMKEILEELNIDNYIQVELISNTPIDLDKIKINRPFVIKATHGCGWNIFVSETNIKMLKISDFDEPRSTPTGVYKELNREDVKRITADWLTRTYSTSEWQYIKIPKQIIIEPFVQFDFEIFCYCIHGKIRLFRTINNEHSVKRTSHYYNSEWESLHNEIQVRENIHPPKDKPPYINTLHEACMKIYNSHKIHFMRIDLFSNKNNYYISEITLTPQGGWRNPTFDDYLTQFV